MSDVPRLSKWQIWWLAARPRTLPASLAGVIMGTALAWNEGHLHFPSALLALLGAIFLQVGSNLANDVYDFERGADTLERLGPLRVTRAGLLTPQQVKGGMWTTFFLAALAGIYLILRAGWPIALLGVTAILAAIGYTAGPFPFGYYGLGDVFVFLYFGLAAVVGSYYVQRLALSPLAWWMAVPIGALTTAILVVNNLRDRPQDQAAGKRTLAVYLGETGTRWEYTLLVAGAFLLLPFLIWRGFLPLSAILPWLALPKAIRLIRQVWKEHGRALNLTLAGTGQMALIYSVLFWLGLVIAKELL
ncbi:MAG: 1,4-dihydroxy-2-naphthoate polyprenyltransferase [Anaerolineales bacterium]